MFLNTFRDAFVIFCDPRHCSLGFGVFHVIGERANFLGSEAPKFWIVRLKSHARVTARKTTIVSKE
jgi:hypothetical protein